MPGSGPPAASAATTGSASAGASRPCGPACATGLDPARRGGPRARLRPRLAGVGLGGPRGPLGAVGRLQAGGGLGLDHPQPGQAGDPPAAGRAEVAPPDPEGVARLLAAAAEQDPELGLFLRLAVVLGARRSELIALKWREVDLGAGEVLI